jgi:hypothetical protein
VITVVLQKISWSLSASRNDHVQETNFKPTIEIISVVRKNNLQKVAGSLNTSIPTTTIPNAPIPVHTAYDVPTGSVFVTVYKRKMLVKRQIRNATNHIVAVGPEVSRSLPIHVAKPISNNPAIMSMIQFMSVIYSLCSFSFAPGC